MNRSHHLFDCLVVALLVSLAILAVAVSLPGCAADPMPASDFVAYDEAGNKRIESTDSTPGNTVTLSDGGYKASSTQPMTGSDMIQNDDRTGLSYLGPGPSTLFNWRVLGIQGASHTDINGEAIEFEFDSEKNRDGLKKVKVGRLSSGASEVIRAEATRLQEAVKWYMHASSEQRVAWVEQQKTIGGAAAAFADAVVETVKLLVAPVPIPTP
jgi:hypothetical protein